MVVDSFLMDTPRPGTIPEIPENDAPPTARPDQIDRTWSQDAIAVGGLEIPHSEGREGFFDYREEKQMHSVRMILLPPRAASNTPSMS